MQSNYPCKECGHEYEAHKVDGPWHMACQRCSWLSENGIAEPGWHVFVPDNLRYLEMMDEKNKAV
jgi:rubredoxin